jgi:hypothetical protein
VVETIRLSSSNAPVPRRGQLAKSKPRHLDIPSAQLMLARVVAPSFASDQFELQGRTPRLVTLARETGLAVSTSTIAFSNRTAASTSQQF